MGSELVQMYCDSSPSTGVIRYSADESVIARDCEPLAVKLHMHAK